MIEDPKPALVKKRIQKLPKQPTKSSTNERQAEAEPTKKKSSLKFAAPIKIIVIDPKSEYCKTVWCAIGIALTNMAIGAVLTFVLHYSIRTNDPHAAICAFGYHFFSAQAILALNYANGWSSPMRTRHRKFAHFFLNMCGIVCAIVGTAMIIEKVGMDDKIMKSPHGSTGIVTGLLVILSAFVGPCVYYRQKTLVLIFHMFLGITAFTMSSLCVCFSLTLKSFESLEGQTAVYLLIGCVIFYTVFIVIGSFMKCMSRLSF